VTRLLAAVLCAAAVLAGCAGEKAPEPKADDIGAQTARIANDTQVLGEAQAAVNEVVRNAPDCEVAKASMAEANRKIEEAEAKVQTATGRTTLDAMRQQVRRVAELCP
jgi:PBP1b-binding outer membrane lipoprotein LpoB